MFFTNSKLNIFNFDSHIIVAVVIFLHIRIDSYVERTLLWLPNNKQNPVRDLKYIYTHNNCTIIDKEFRRQFQNL